MEVRKSSKQNNARAGSKCNFGINFHSKCDNKECAYYKKSIRCPLGFGEINVLKMAAKCVCPVCGVKAAGAYNFGFLHCRVTIKG